MSSQERYGEEEVEESEGAAENVHNSEVEGLPNWGDCPQLPEDVLAGLVGAPGEQHPHKTDGVAK